MTAVPDPTYSATPWTAQISNQALVGSLPVPPYVPTSTLASSIASEGLRAVNSENYIRASVATVVVPPPTGATAVDTPNIVNSVARLASALSFGPATLYFQDGTYQIDSLSFVIQSLSNFAVKSSGRAHVTQAPNRASMHNNVTGDLCVIADCTDFTVEGVTFDCLRDANAPITPLSSTANSGQPSVTVAAGAAANFFPGNVLGLFGGLGSGDQDKSEGLSIGGASGRTILSVTPGGGAGGGDLVTFTTNLTNTYTTVSATPISDGFGPYACQGAYLTYYQTGTNTVAGRTIGGEDQQNAIHLMNCQRFTLSKVTGRNTWESPIKCGNGSTSSSLLTDGCADGTITDCTGYHGYDQGVSLWLCDNITVKGCTVNAAGWGGMVMTASDHCLITGNRMLNSVYRVPGDHSEGNGLAIEGGIGNVVTGNYLSGYNNDGMRIILSPLYFGLNSNLAFSPTTSTFLETGTAAGTPIQVSSTTHLSIGARMSILDGMKTEAVTIATTPDSTHVTFSQPLQFSHASGVTISRRIPQENIIANNILVGPGTSAPSGGGGTNGINNLQVRGVVTGNRITGWGTGAGIQSSISGTSQPSGIFAGGEGSVISNNYVSNGAGTCITAWGQSGLLAQGYVIRNNVCWNPAATFNGIDLRAVANSDVSGNIVHQVAGGGSGILLSTQSATGCAGVNVADNLVRDCSLWGIELNVADHCTVESNRITSCGGAGGTYGALFLQGVTNSVIAKNHCWSNSQSGIYLSSGSGIQSQYNRITDNTCFDDGTGRQVINGTTINQTKGIVEAASSDYNIFERNNLYSNISAQLTVIGTHSVQRNNLISNVVVPVTSPVVTPSFANGTAAQLSDTGRDYMVYLEIGTAGTAFTVAIGPTSTPANTVVSSGVATSGEVITVRLPAGWYLEWTATTATLASQIAIGA